MAGLLAELVEALRVLPGVGPKGAQRMAFHLLERNREGGLHLAALLEAAMARIQRCSRCRDFSEEDLCAVCQDPRRDGALLCVVESPADVAALETAGAYRGRYFVLHGHLSPIDGIGPEELGLDGLDALLRDGAVGEVILATNATVEGEATAHFISEQVTAAGVPVSRIAHGVPLGGELEYIDGSTLAHALAGRRTLGSSA